MKCSVVFGCLVMTSLSGYTHCMKVKTLEKQLVQLAGRQTLDRIAREELNERLKSVEKSLNDSTEHTRCCDSSTQSSDNTPISSYTNESFVDKKEFFRLVKAFKEEEAATGRMRRHVTTKVNSLEKQVENVSHDLASTRTNMCTASESQTISTFTESIQSEVENISQTVQFTNTDVAIAIHKIDNVEESLGKQIGDVSETIASIKSEMCNTKLQLILNVMNSLKNEFEVVGQSIKSISDRIDELENSRTTSATKAHVDRLETIDKRVATILQKILKQSCLSHYRAGSTEDGVYTILPRNYKKPIEVYCDMTTDGGGWTAFQRRMDGSVDFYRDWQDYKQGFGNIKGDIWLGNDNIAALTSSCCHELRIDMRDFDNRTSYAKYGKFKILPENENYSLYVDQYSGNAGDSFLQKHNNMSFTTKDHDNDKSLDNSAVLYKGGWWYNSCYWSNLNGLFDKTLGTSNQRIKRYTGTLWEVLAMTEMKLR